MEQACSYNLGDIDNRRFALENLEQLVIKTRQGYGGLGVFVMPKPCAAWRKPLAKPKVYRCVVCEWEVYYPDIMYRDGRCERCHTTSAK